MNTNAFFLKFQVFYVGLQVVMTVSRSRMTLSVDERRFSIAISPQNILKMYFHKLFVGGFEDYANAPWPLYSRQGYRGCLEALKVNNLSM